jgi:hypothetical protein
MDYKRLTAILIVATMLGMILPMLPVRAGTHPCEATFEAKINGKSSWMDTTPLGVSIREPEYGFCKEFTVEIWINNVVDMYAYEFMVNWTDTEHIVLVDYKVHTEYWAKSIVVRPDVVYAISIPDPKMNWYIQAASAIAPSTGFTGSAKLATLTFHIYNDVCWTTDYVDSAGYVRKKIFFNFYDMKVSDSCSNTLNTCDPKYGYLKFWAVQPKIYLEPNYEENSELPGKFTKTVWVANITKMHSLYFNLSWNYYNYVGAWKTSDPDYPKVWPQFEVEDFTLLIKEPLKYPLKRGVNYDWSDWWFWMDIELKDPPYANLLNGTFPVIEILFKKVDPWACGRQPLYYSEQPHEWYTYPCFSDFWFEWGAIDVLCPEKRWIIFGDYLGDTRTNMTTHVQEAVYFDYEQGVDHDWTANLYVFTAIPGDLNLDGVVDITDVLIIASMYGKPLNYPYIYYDFNMDGVIDIFDIVIVCKNFGRTVP